MRRGLQLMVLAGALVSLSGGLAVAQSADTKPAATAADLAKIAKPLTTGLVRIEYTLKYDKGEGPGYLWSLASQESQQGYGGWKDTEQLIKEERPMEMAGFLIGASRVITEDPKFHPRFLDKIVVCIGDERIEATADSFAVDQDAWFLTLAQPTKTGKPLEFDAKRERPYYAVNYSESDGKWGVGIGGAGGGGGVYVKPSGEALVVDRSSLYVDKAGGPVGMNFSGLLDADGAWRGSPERWATIKAAEMQKLLGDLEAKGTTALPRVALRFRSPRADSSAESMYGMSYGGGSDSSMTEWNGSGILVDESTVLVLANFKPKLTGRLESIQVFGTDSKGVKATFAGTLKDYGAFLAKLETPMKGAATIFDGDITTLRGELLLKARIGVVGEQRTAYYWRDRFGGFEVGWRRHLYPRVTTSPYRSYGGGDEGESFYFTRDMRLAGIPLPRREKVATEERYSYGSGSGLVASPYVAELLRERDKHLDPENRPLTEDEENRLAWLGVELQPMDAELARENKVIDETAGGENGAIVTYLYPDSPATKVGIQMGDIIVRLNVEGQPKPLDVSLDGMGDMSGYFMEMMERIDEIPPEYLDRLPKPWGAAENSLTRALTDIGFGTPFVAEVYRDGKMVRLDMKIEEGPSHYDAAKRFKSKAAGFTIRDLTYEVRRFYQLKPDDAGVILSKVEKGERGAIAGLKPFELITAVDDAPVKSVADVEKAIAAGGEFRLSVKRMTTGRIVKLKVGAAEPDDGKDDEEAEPEMAPGQP